MTDIEKIIVAAVLSFGLGMLSGVLLEKVREHARLYQSVLDAYLKSVSDTGINEDEYLRFAALQRAGAHKLSLRQLRRLAADIRGRGFRHPYVAWANAFPEQNDFPKGFLRWAREREVDLSKPDSAMLAIAEEWDTRSIPSPPQPPSPGVFFLDGF